MATESDIPARGSINIVEHFPFPRGDPHTLEIRYLFSILQDLIDALESESDWVAGFRLLTKIYADHSITLEALSLEELVTAQHICSTYETAVISEEIEMGFDEMRLLRVRRLLLDAIKAKNS